ncbi:MAG TPA: hypothetical protein VGC71_11735 [Gaiellales bacterium]
MTTTTDRSATEPGFAAAYTPHEHEELRALARARDERRQVPSVLVAAKAAPKPA